MFYYVIFTRVGAFVDDRPRDQLLLHGKKKLRDSQEANQLLQAKQRQTASTTRQRGTLTRPVQPSLRKYKLKAVVRHYTQSGMK